MRVTDPDEAAGHLRRTDTLGIPLGPGQPAAFMDALGRRMDWEELRISGALLTVITELFSHPNVHYLSGFYGPIERLLRDSGAHISFAPADFRRFIPLMAAVSPRCMCTAASPPDAEGWCSLSLHAGAGVAELHAAGADPDRLLVVEVSERYPCTVGLPPAHRHAVHVDDVDLLIESDREPLTVDDPPPTDVERSIAEQVRAFVTDGATLQTGIGAVPSMVAAVTTASTPRCSPPG